MKINKSVLKIGLIYILIIISVATMFYYLGYVHSLNYSNKFYENYINTSCLCNLLY